MDAGRQDEIYSLCGQNPEFAGRIELAGKASEARPRLKHRTDPFALNLVQMGEGLLACSTVLQG